MRDIAVWSFIAILAVGVFVLRETTMTRHEEVPDDSSLEVAIRADAYTEDDPFLRLTRAHIDLCVAESMPQVDLGEIREIDDPDPHDPGDPLPTYRFTTRPGADAPDRDQLHGCLEDLRVRHLRLDVLEMVQRVEGEVVTRRGSTP